VTPSPTVALVALALLVFCTGSLGLACNPSQDSAHRPSSLVPTPRTDEWAVARENECIRRARESAPARLVFVGDSITQSWEDPGKAAWDAHLAPLGAVNLGNSGDRTEHVLHRLAEAPLTRLEPEHVFILIGTNNLGHGSSNAAETLAGVKAVAETIAAQCPQAAVHIIEIFPRGEALNAMRGDILQINQALRAWVAAQRNPRLSIHAIGDAFVSPDGTISKDLMPDALHLTPKAYEMWAEAVLRIAASNAASNAAH
jgi:lysophospholipase L1-like esterase